MTDSFSFELTHILLILVQDTCAGKKNRKNPDFVCIIKKKKEKGGWEAVVMVRRRGEGDLVKKVPSGIALSAVQGGWL